MPQRFYWFLHPSTTQLLKDDPWFDRTENENIKGVTMEDINLYPPSDLVFDCFNDIIVQGMQNGMKAEAR